MDRHAPVEPMLAIAERKINEWIENGGQTGVRGTGHPQQLDDEPFVPDDMRLSFKILRNAGFIPDWAELGNAVDSERDAIEVWLGQNLEALARPASSADGGGLGNLAETTNRARRRRIEPLVADYRERLKCSTRWSTV